MKYIVISMVVMTAAVSLAAPKPLAQDKNKDGKVSQEEFLESNKKRMESKGKTFDPEMYKKRFADKDLDKDGYLNKEESVIRGSSGGKKKKDK